MSGCNSGIFSSSRMVYTLAQKGQMPRIFTKVMRTGVPFFAVLAISVGIFVGVILNIVLPLIIDGSENIFVYVYSASILPGMVPWFMILLSHIRFRKKSSRRIRWTSIQNAWRSFHKLYNISFLCISIDRYVI